MTHWTRRLYEPVDAASLACFRILFGGIMVWEVLRYFSHDWITRYYIVPVFHFSYYGFDWLRPWPGNGMYVHFVVIGILALYVALGFFYRISTILFFFAFTYVFLLDQAQYLNHFYLVCLIGFLMMFAPAHRIASLDAWLSPSRRSETVPAWSVWMFRLQFCLVYFYAGVAKLNDDWLRGEPMRSWLARRTDFCLLGPFLRVGRWFTEEWVVYGFAYGGLLLDLAIAPLLLWRKTRPYAFAAGVFFHLTNNWLFQIGIFPWFAIAGMLLFFDPDWPRRIFNWPRSDTVGLSDSPVPATMQRRWSDRAAIGILAVHLVLQAIVPLRHLLYPGDVSWTEEGHRFSWHMKLRDKSAKAVFRATDPATGETWTIDLSRSLTPRQAKKMASRPDMVLQFCHFVAEQLHKSGRPGVEIRTEVWVSLNGRPLAPLIDPTVDLATVPRSLGHATWILPLSEPLPGSAQRGAGDEAETDE